MPRLNRFPQTRDLTFIKNGERLFPYQGIGGETLAATDPKVLLGQV